MCIVDHYFSEMKASDSLRRKLVCCYDMEGGRVMILKALKIPGILSIRKGDGYFRGIYITCLQGQSIFTFA
jgi:hypothetical protein